MPREHGAYVELGAPLLTALLKWPSWHGLAIALAIVVAFVGNEALLVWTGARGRRAQAAHGPRAKRQFAFMSVVAAALFAGGMWLCPGHARGTVAAIGGLGIAVGALVLTGNEKTVWGELFIVGTLSATPFAVGIPGGGGAHEVAPVALVWGAILGVQTLVVHALKGRAGAAVGSWVMIALVVGGAVMAVVGGAVAPLFAGALVAPLGLAMALLYLRPARRHLIRIGLALLAVDVVALAVLVGA